MSTRADIAVMMGNLSLAVDKLQTENDDLHQENIVLRMALERAEAALAQAKKQEEVNDIWTALMLQGQQHNLSEKQRQLDEAMENSKDEAREHHELRMNMKRLLKDEFVDADNVTDGSSSSASVHKRARQ